MVPQEEIKVMDKAVIIPWPYLFVTIGLIISLIIFFIKMTFVIAETMSENASYQKEIREKLGKYEASVVQCKKVQHEIVTNCCSQDAQRQILTKFWE